MRAYPPEYRAEREDEMIATLLERAGIDRSSPTIGEAWDLISNGVAVRAASSGGESRRAGRGYASLIACAVTSAVTTLLVALWISGFYPSVSDIEFVALWSPFALLVLWYLTQVTLLARFGWVLIALCFVAVVAGPDHTMAQRSLLAALTVLALAMVAAPVGSSPKLLSRVTAVLIGISAGVAMVVRYNLKFDYLVDHGVATLWGALPHPPGALVPLLVAAAVGLMITCLFRPAVAIAVGIVIVPVAVIGFLLSNGAFFLTVSRQQIFRSLLACIAAVSLVVYGIVASMQTRGRPASPGGG